MFEITCENIWDNTWENEKNFFSNRYHFRDLLTKISSSISSLTTPNDAFVKLDGYDYRSIYNCDEDNLTTSIYSLNIQKNSMILEDLSLCYQKLKQISEFEDNWNNEGAAKFSAEFLNTLEEILKSLKYVPDIFPTANESIQFEYEKTSGDYLEFEIFENLEALILLIVGDNEREEHVPLLSAKEINERVSEFYER